MMRSAEMTLYDELEVSPKATVETIRAAHRSLVKRYHPDRNPDDPEAADRIRRVNAAYTVLSDVESRRVYDARLTLEVARGSRPDVSRGSRPDSSRGSRPDSSRGSRPDGDPRRASTVPPPYSQHPHQNSHRPPPRASHAPPPRSARTPSVPVPPAQRKKRKTMTLIAAGVGVVCLAGLLAAWTISIKPRRMRADLAARSAAAAAASAMPPRPDLSLDDQLTIGRACSPLQAKGDDLGYRQCKTTQLAIAASTTRPSLEGIPLHIVMNARAACEQFQIRGDIAGHRACFQKKLAEPRP